MIWHGNEKVRSNTPAEGSVLWLGLGQAGRVILRECLLYCLDNLNDARCSALIQSLGVTDLNELKAYMLGSKQRDVVVRTDAEHALRGVFDRELHVLAMNLGGEVDDLVEPDAPVIFCGARRKSKLSTVLYEERPRTPSNLTPCKMELVARQV